jgi:hypothetical protein
MNIYRTGTPSLCEDFQSHTTISIVSLGLIAIIALVTLWVHRQVIWSKNDVGEACPGFRRQLLESSTLVLRDESS